MSELPARPDLHQLRRQARELLRAATDGEPHALTRLRAVSDRITLSAAQLAVAREHGFRSWPALRSEIERRRSSARWSFGGAAAIETAAGVLSPSALVIGPGHAAMEASLIPSGWPERVPTGPGEGRGPVPRQARAALAATMTGWARARRFDDVVVTDDQGTRYGLRLEGSSGMGQQPGEARAPVWLRLGLDPVPARTCRWLELRNQEGAATRLLPSARTAVRVSQPAAAAGSPAERELAGQALGLIDLQLIAAGQDDAIARRCAAALARAAEIRRSGELDTASELPDQLARLCASLAGPRPADGLPPAWSGMLNAAQRTDGPPCHLDIAAALPEIDGVAVQLDSLVSEPGSWRVHLRARPGWWTYSEDHQRKWEVMSVHAEDDLGGMYLSSFGGSTGHGDYEELALRFRPRLDPLASTLKLTFTRQSQQVTAELALVPAVKPEKGRAR